MRETSIRGVDGRDGLHLYELLFGREFKVCDLLKGQRYSRLKELEARFPLTLLIGKKIHYFAKSYTLVNDLQRGEIYN